MLQYPIIYMGGLIVAMILDIIACATRGWAVCGLTFGSKDEADNYNKQLLAKGSYLLIGRITDLDFFDAGRAIFAFVIISILLLATSVILELLMQFVPAVGKNNKILKIISLICCGFAVVSMCVVMAVYGEKVYSSGFSMWIFSMAFVLTVESLAIGLISFFG